VVRSIPLRRPAVLPLLVPDVLHAAERGENLAASAAVVLFELACEALLVASTPVGNQPDEPTPVHGPTPGRPDRAGLAGVALLGAGF
jgi:hypothetical protein